MFGIKYLSKSIHHLAVDLFRMLTHMAIKARFSDQVRMKETTCKFESSMLGGSIFVLARRSTVVQDKTAETV